MCHSTDATLPALGRSRTLFQDRSADYLLCSWFGPRRHLRLRISGVHDHEPSSAVAPPDRDVPAVTELLAGVGRPSAHDRVSAGGRTNIAAAKYAGVGRLPV